MKIPEFGTKNALFGYIWARILKNYLKSEPSNLSNCKILRKNKNASIWDQKCLIWVFFDWSLQIILQNLKSVLSNLTNCKISWNMKMTKFGTKNALFGYFSTGFWKNYCDNWNQHPQIYQKCVSNFCKEFWYRVRFF